MKALGTKVGLAMIALLLAGCGEDPLPGERLDVRAPLTVESDGSPAVPGREGSEAPVSRDVPISLPAQVNHSAWTHRGGSPVHRLQHPALGASLTRVWSANIGAGATRKHSITAEPVIVANRIFTLDSQAGVMAHSTGGGLIWSRDLTPTSDNRRDASGGGLAYGDGRLFVTTGFGQLQALDPASGRTIWVQQFDAPISGAPTVRGELVYVSGRDNQAFGVRASNGRLLWQLPAAPTPSVTINGAGPAVTDRIAVFPFGSAELIGALRQGGLRIWSTTVAGQRLGKAYAGVTDISADPVVLGNTIYVGSPSGRIAAIDVNSGERIWTATEGAMGLVSVEGGSVFATTDIQQLVRLNASTGELIWSVDLSRFKAKRARRNRDVFAHYGPRLAGGRLIVASDDGFIRTFNPRNGALLSTIELKDGAATAPVVVNRTLYVVTTKGQLVAFR